MDKAIKKTGDAIVSMRARPLWNDRAIPPDAGHAVYVTGAEVDKSGSVVGYYINDTGSGEAARFVRKADFMRAWNYRFVAFQ